MNIPRYNFENLDINKINDDIHDKGIAIIDNFLSSDQSKKISNEHKFIYDNNIQIGKYYKDNFTKSFLINYRMRDLKFNKELEFSNQIIKDKNI